MKNKHNKYNNLVLVMICAVFCIAALGSVSATDIGNNSTNITNTTGLANSSSPEYQVNNNHTGQSNYVGPQTNNTQWTKNITLTQFTTVSTGSDGTIYGGSNGILYALSPHDGSVLWSYSAGDTISCTPAVGNDGTIYVVTENGTMYAISSKGKLVWTTFNGAGSGSCFPAIGYDGTIYIVTNDNKLWAINSTNGTSKWNATLNGETYNAPTIGSDGMIYVATTGTLYAIYPTNGAVDWTCNIGSISNCESPSIGSDGTIYIGCMDTDSYTNGILYAINSTTGKIKWNYTTDDILVAGTPAIGSDGTIYFISTGNSGTLYSLTYNGTNVIKNWSYILGSCDNDMSVTIGSDGTIYAGTMDGTLYAFDSITGAPKWSYHVGQLCGTPVIGSNGALYVPTLDNFVAFNDDTVPPTVKSVDPVNGATGVSLNKSVTVTFSEPVKMGNGAIALQSSNGTLIPVTTSVSGSVLTITPKSALSKGVRYTVLVHTGSVTDLAGNNVAGYVSRFTTTSDTTAPTVSSVDPVNGATGVGLNKSVTVTFSEPVKMGNGAIALQSSNGTLIPVTTSVSGSVLTITPKSALSKGVRYTVLVHTGSVTDLAGNNVAGYVSRFTTTSDTTAPTVSSVDPVNGATGVGLNKSVTVTFSEPVKMGNGAIALQSSNGTLIPVTTSVSGSVLTITPKSALSKGVRYTVLVHTGSVTDLAGNNVAGYVSRFTTTSDTTAPTVSSVDPVNGATGVGLNKSVTVTFSEPVKMGNGAIALQSSNGTLIPVTTSVSGSVLTITPKSALSKGVRYTVLVHTGSVTDLAGNNVAGYVSRFTTTSDTTAPTVSSVDPVNGATGVGLNKSVTVTFSEPVKMGNGAIALQSSNGTLIPVTTSVSGSVLTITPKSALSKGVRYTVLVHTGSVTDLAGNNVAGYVSRFTTSTA